MWPKLFLTEIWYVYFRTLSLIDFYGCSFNTWYASFNVETVYVGKKYFKTQPPLTSSSKSFLTTEYNNEIRL